ncbi:MAG: serine--tRNA ligase [Candidatus Kerfeldbacteria bacterium]|nr:serine--tRNA ligase [Candidatus Kerfeldbacteria bacterium]
MINLKDFLENPERYIAGFNRRGFDGNKIFLELPERSNQQKELESWQQQVHEASKIIPTLSPAEKKKKIAEMKKISDKIALIKSNLRVGSLVETPNLPKDDVPDGKNEEDNVVLREVGKKPKLESPQEYLALAELLGIIDMARGSKVSGSRFGYLLGAAAQLEFALVQFAQSIILPAGFTMVVPPALIKSENMAAMGFLAGGGERETYHFTDDDLYLVGTSEQSIGPMHRDETFNEEDLPKRYLAFSSCFRREAGSYGKDTKGIIRVHQFDKLEMFSFCLPEKSDQEQEFFLGVEEKLMQKLELPYRVVKLCAADLGWSSARTYDIETWMPGQAVYRETHSTSTTTDYQSRDLHIKVHRGEKKEFVHMINGTAFAIGRTLVGIIENYQQRDGSIAIPQVLQPFMGGLKSIKAPAHA